MSEETGFTNWAKHMDPNTTITVRSKTKISILNVSLGFSVRETLQRSSFLVKIKDKGSFYMVCSFLPGRVENHHCDLTLFPGKEYQLRASGANPIDLLGIEELELAVTAVEEADVKESPAGSGNEDEDEEPVKGRGKSESSSPKKIGSKKKSKAPTQEQEEQEEAPADEKVKKPRGRPRKDATGKSAGRSGRSNKS